MFDDSELDRLRDERDRWEHGDRRPADEPSSYTHSTKRVVSGIGFSTALVAILLSMMISINMVAAVGIGQVGGFSADFPELNGTDIAIYPAVGETAACEYNVSTSDGRPTNAGEAGLPLLKADMGKANVTKVPVTLVKNINMPDTIQDTVGIAVIQINLTQGPAANPPVILGDASLQLTNLRAEEMNIRRKTTIFENYSNGPGTPDPIFGPGNGFALNADHGEWAIQGKQVLMTNGTARAHFLGFQSMENMQDMRLDVIYNPTNNNNTKDSDDCYSSPNSIF